MQVSLERGGVHGHQHVGVVARGGDVVVGDVDLERRDAVDGAGGRSDLGGEVGHRRQVVAERSAHRCEAVARELHPVAGVASEADDEVVEYAISSACRPVDRVGHMSSPKGVLGEPLPPTSALSAPAPLPGLMMFDGSRWRLQSGVPAGRFLDCCLQSGLEVVVTQASVARRGGARVVVSES